MSNLNLNDGKFRSSINGIENGRTSQVSGVNAILNEIVGNTNYLKNEVDKKADSSISIIAGDGLDGGGDLSANRTINIVSKNDGIIVNPNDIQLNIYDGVDSPSTTRPASAGAVKKTYDKSVEVENSIDTKLDKGTIPQDWNSAEKIKNNWYKIIPKNIGRGANYAVDLNAIIEDGIYLSNSSTDTFINIPPTIKAEFKLICIGKTLDTPFYKTQILIAPWQNDIYIRTCKSYQAPWVWTEWSKILHTNQQINELKTSNKKPIDAINESLWRNIPNAIGNSTSSTHILSINQSGYYISKDYNNKWEGLPSDFDSRGAFYLDVRSYAEGQNQWKKYTIRSLDSPKIWELTTNNSGTVAYGWHQLITNRSLFYLGAVGLGNEIRYIQDNIIKEVGKGYVDKITGKPYSCIKQAQANIVTPNAEYFEPADNIILSAKVQPSTIISCNTETVRWANSLMIPKIFKTIEVYTSTGVEQHQGFSRDYIGSPNVSRINIKEGYISRDSVDDRFYKFHIIQTGSVDVWDNRIMIIGY